MVAREQLLHDLRAELISFEGRYLRQVGLLFRRLDEWEQKIAELHGKGTILDASENELDFEDTLPQIDPVELKSIYRDLVKLLHPDFATDQADERRRTRLMAMANDAYAREDVAAIRRMLSGYDPSLTLQSVGGTHQESVRLAALLFQITQDIEAVDLQLEELQRSETARLQQRALDAARQGRDLLAEMAARVNGSIGLAMRRYELDLARKQRPSKGLAVEDLVSAEIKTD